MSEGTLNTYTHHRAPTVKGRKKMDMAEKIERVCRTDVIDVLSKALCNEKDYNHIINRLASICYEASRSYEKNGYDCFAKETNEIANGLFGLLDNIGFYDHVK